MTSEYREVTFSPHSNEWVTTAASDGTLSVWHAGTKRPLARFQSIWSPGGYRLAAVGEPPLVVVASWESRAIAGYSPQGEVVWQRKEREPAQWLTALQERGIAVGYKRGPAQILSSQTGETTASLRGVASAHGSSDGDDLLCAGPTGWYGGYDRASGSYRWRYRDSTEVMAVAFAPGRVLVSEKQLRCHDLGGRVEWEWAPPAGSLVAALSWSDRLSAWACVLYFYEENRNDALAFLSEDGAQVDSRDQGRRARRYSFSPDGSLLANSFGEVQRITSGEVLWRLEDGDIA